MNFIKQIEIENFFSIKNRIVVNFEANEYLINNKKNRVTKFNDKFYNKIISFYGANASGKTTILKSLVVLGAIINNRRDNLPFSIKNKFAHSNTKTKIFINFVIDNQEFIYELVLDSNRDKINNKINNESLYLIEDEKKEKFFDRKEKKINIHLDGKTKKTIFNSLSDTISIIEEFKIFDENSYLSKIQNFFKVLIGSTNIETAFISKIGIEEKDEFDLVINLEKIQGLKEFIFKFFNSIGIDIDDIKIDYEEDSDKNIKKFKNLFLYHNVNSKIPIDYKLESDGTKTLLKILSNIYIAYKEKSVLVIDELDSVLHSFLVPIINELVCNSDIQIIYSSHNLYNLKFLYPTELFIIEKDFNHNTNIYSPKKNIKDYDNLLFLYENGKLGGLPLFDNLIMKIEK
jgi:AAA15 family ATPase/GTPase